MKIKRILFLINSLWELARFLLLFLALGTAFRLTLLADRGAVYWLILLGSAQLLLPAALLLLYLDPLVFAGLLNLVRLGKFLGILSGVLFVFFSPSSAAPGAGSRGVFPFPPHALVVGVVLLDMIVLFLLFLWSPDPVPQPPRNSLQGQPLPEHRETPIEAPPD